LLEKSKQKKENQNLKGRFLRLHFEVTGKCNLRCRHCYNSEYLKNGEDLTTLEVKTIINKAKNIGCETFTFSGGEPFCRKDIVEIIKYAGDPVIFITNSYNLTKDLLKKIAKINKTIEFRVSWDGYNGHFFIRKKEWESVLEKIKELIDLGFIVTVNSSLIKQNVNELERMYEEVVKLKIDRWRVDVPYVSGSFVKNSSVMSVDLTKAFPVIRNIVKSYLFNKPNIEIDIIQAFRSQLLKQESFFNFDKNSHPCDYRRVLAIRPDGGMSYCATWNKVFGNVLKEEINDITLKKEWQDFEKIKIKNLNKCNKCKYLKICGGGCRARAFYSTGNIRSPDPLACQVYELSEKYIWPILPKKVKNILYSSIKS